MLSRPDHVTDRYGEETKVGDYVFYLRGSLAGDNYYETCGEVAEIHPRQRIVKLDNGDLLLWHEFWKESIG